MIFIEISRALTYDKCLPSILFNLVMNPMKGSYCSILQMRAQGQRGQINFPMSINGGMFKYIVVDANLNKNNGSY